ncbi:enzymatic polyprotein [Plakobranchus ocellatus]|uniref:Enzymatic polyprotein n=1 Tax=Plakobranchus ocellatus TaxID=259542 RepID=A0AAV3ZQS9_9GAST|nr:enzymatic polyprotein [Plakobranchus ocellatus]
MSGPPMRLIIDDDATPVAHHTPIPVPIHWQEQVKAGLDQDVRLDVFEPVPIGTPVSWCHRMVVCAKKSGKLRRTIDLQALNRHATRETHHTQSPFHQARMFPPNTRKTTFDVWNGYHSIALDPKDRHLTTFSTPWGRYRYCVCPQGYIASGDAYTRHFDEVVSDIDNKTKVIVDTIMWSPSIEDSKSGWTCVAAMVSSSTLRNSPLLKKLSTSQALKSPPQPFTHAHKFWKRSKDFPNPAPSLT